MVAHIASSDAGVVELSARGLPAVLPPHLLAPLPAGKRGTLAAADPSASNRRRDPGNAVPPAGLGRSRHPGRSGRRLASVSVGFLWMHYAAINWAAIYFVPVFVREGLLVLWLGTARGRLAFVAERSVAGMIGIALYVYALALHPLIALVAGRPLQVAEVVGIAPDPTAIATLGLLSLAPRRAGALPLIILPIIWCLASALTLRDDGRIGGLDPVDGGGAGCLGAGVAPPERDMLQLECCTR